MEDLKKLFTNQLSNIRKYFKSSPKQTDTVLPPEFKIFLNEINRIARESSEEELKNFAGAFLRIFYIKLTDICEKNKKIANETVFIYYLLKIQELHTYFFNINSFYTDKNISLKLFLDSKTIIEDILQPAEAVVAYEWIAKASNSYDEEINYLIHNNKLSHHDFPSNRLACFREFNDINVIERIRLKINIDKNRDFQNPIDEKQAKRKAVYDFLYKERYLKSEPKELLEQILHHKTIHFIEFRADKVYEIEYLLRPLIENHIIPYKSNKEIKITVYINHLPITKTVESLKHNYPRAKDLVSDEVRSVERDIISIWNK